MYICTVLRSLDKSPPIFALSPQQLEHCHVLCRALTENADLSEPVHALSFSLISTYVSDVQRDTSLCPLSRFITFWHLREDGTFQPPSSISPNLASITFCFRAIAILEARARMLADPSIIFMEYALFFSLQTVSLTYLKILFQRSSSYIERGLSDPFQRSAAAHPSCQHVCFQLRQAPRHALESTTGYPQCQGTSFTD